MVATWPLKDSTVTFLILEKVWSDYLKQIITPYCNLLPRPVWTIYATAVQKLLRMDFAKTGVTDAIQLALGQVQPQEEKVFC